VVWEGIGQVKLAAPIPIPIGLFGLLFSPLSRERGLNLDACQACYLKRGKVMNGTDLALYAPSLPAAK
jgi:hypothetical protein